MKGTAIKKGKKKTALSGRKGVSNRCNQRWVSWETIESGFMSRSDNGASCTR